MSETPPEPPVVPPPQPKVAVRKKLFQSHDPYAGLQTLPFNNHSWNNIPPIFEKAIDLADPCKLVVEVGTWMGGSARTMAEILKRKYPGDLDLEIVCVDTFLGSVEHWTRESYLMTFVNGHPTIYHHFLSNNIFTGNQDIITPFPCDSINAYETLKKWQIQPDLVYIDAGHDYKSVYADIERWTEVLRPGGVLLLDDAHHPPIIQAVGDYLKDTATSEMGKFIWQKPKT